MWSYWLNGCEILHFHADDELSVRLTHAAIREQRARLEADPRVRLGPRSRDWVDVTFASETDLPLVLDLVRSAIAANAGSR